MTDFSERLRTFRKRKGLTQADVAQRLGITPGGYSGYETGRREPDVTTIKKLADILHCTGDELIGTDYLFQSDRTIPRPKMVPLLGSIKCGKPTTANQEYGLYVATDGDINADFCLEAKGDSMIDARITDGDIVFIKSQPEVPNGQIAAVRIGDDTTLKRVYYYPEKGLLILKACNPRYEDLIYQHEELNEIEILGKAIVFQSRVS